MTKKDQLSEVRIRIVLTGGGTGGHIYPLISVHRALKSLTDKKLYTLETTYIGPDGFARQSFEKEGIKIIIIKAGKWRRYFSLLNIFDIFNLIIGFFQSLWHLWRIMPDLIFSKGGYGSLPVVLVAWIYRIPLFIHESDTIPGLSNRLAAKFATKIGIAFSKSLEYFPKEKTALVGNPIRKDYLLTSLNKEKARQYFGFASDKPLLLVLGGSQGSQRINDLILECLGELIKNNIQVLHQTGEANYREVMFESKVILDLLPKEYRDFYLAKGFLEEKEYALALTAADVVVARAGSGTIFELSIAKKPAILIPLPEAAGDHQKMNALEYANFGAGVVLEEKNILPHLFIDQILEIINDQEKLNRMSNRASLFFRGDAAQLIAQEIFQLLNL